MQDGKLARFAGRIVSGLVLVASTLLAIATPSVRSATAQEAGSATPTADRWVVLAWNDLGMHCYNRDFQDLAVLPPYNTLWAQVIKVGDPPQVITGTVAVSYAFADNTYSVGKSNFWQYDKQLFGVDLAPNIGLTGKGLAGAMDRHESHFAVEGIPLTEFSDSAPTTAAPYQLATVIARDTATGAELARTTTVAPVSTEMHCDNCHYDGGVENIRTGRVETNILTLHDRENKDEYPAGHTTPLMNRRPVLCAECHASNALNAPGVAGLPSLSRAMHDKHADVDDDEAALAAALPQNYCYNCHPGPTTQCLRDVMATEHNMTCTDCHGSMEQVAANQNPWLNEPRCDDCHKAPAFKQDHPLYRMSSGHGGIYCAGCHDSPHAIAPSAEPNDAIKFVGWQGHPGTLDTCTVCHLTDPTDPGPHGASSPWGASFRAFMPELNRRP